MSWPEVCAAGAAARDASDPSPRAHSACDLDGALCSPLDRLEALLHHHVVGHRDAKRALVLALACREHAYLEGPPGTAKTLLAEVLARGCGLRFFGTQLHRDTRASDLLGDVVLERTPLPDGDGERIRQHIEPGRVLTAEICLLDDISRAPGEALNVLLRVLNERHYGDGPLPLRCAIATGNPADDLYANEPLDPAQLDRFTVQIRVGGMLAGGDASTARALLDRFADAPPEPVAGVAPVVSGTELDSLHDAILRVRVPAPVREVLVALLRTLVLERGIREENSLLTDRTFLVKVLKLLRGSAVLANRTEVTLDDLAVLPWLTTCRLPSGVHAELPELIQRHAAQRVT
jgi:MoxR-like ATPase